MLDIRELYSAPVFMLEQADVAAVMEKASRWLRLAISITFHNAAPMIN